MNKFEMTDDEIAEARWAAQAVAKQADGEKINDGLRIGAVLLKGRHWAMKVAGVNIPNGKQYALAFHSWKQEYGFREGKEVQSFYDAAMVCAANRDLANEIVDGLSLKQKLELGMFGLEKRVRSKLKADMAPEKPKETPKKIATKQWAEDLDGKVCDLEDRLDAMEPTHVSEWAAGVTKYNPEEVLETLRLRAPAWFAKLLAAVRAREEWNAKAKKPAKKKVSKSEDAPKTDPVP